MPVREPLAVDLGRMGIRLYKRPYAAAEFVFRLASKKRAQILHSCLTRALKNLL